MLLEHLHALGWFLAPFVAFALCVLAIRLATARATHARSDAERAALDALTTLAATCARSAAVTLGAHDGPIDAGLAERIVVQVVLDLRVLGSETIARARALQHLTRDTVEQLLTAVAREQVSRLRETQAAFATLLPDPALEPAPFPLVRSLHAETLPMGLAVARTAPERPDEASTSDATSPTSPTPAPLPAP